MIPPLDKPHHGSKVALFLGRKLLSIQRDDDPSISYPGLWDLPGGGREHNETPFETLAREVKEEIGLILPMGAVLWEKAFLSDHSSERWHAFYVAQMVAEAEADIRLGDEGQGWTLYEVEAFLALPDRVPLFDRRLGAWLTETGGLP